MLINYSRDKDIDLNWSEIQIRSKKYNSKKSKAANYFGKLKFIFGDWGIIYKTKIDFDYIEIDLMTTPSWFELKNNVFKLREKLFSKLGLKQEPRPKTSLNKIKQLSKEEIEKVNNFINNSKEYSSTIKGINALFTGSNPAGERKNPNASPLFGIHKGSHYNIATFFKFYYSYNNYINDDIINDIFDFSKIDFEDYIEKYLPNDSKESFFKFQKPSSSQGWKKAKNILEQKLKNNRDLIKVVDNCINKARTKFYNETNFEVFPLKKFETEKAHIVPVYYLKKMMIESKIKNDEEKFISYCNDISNVDNYLNLINAMHRLFDKKFFTYSETGEIQILKESEQEKINELNKKHEKIFSKIPEKFLTNGRLSYLKKREKLLIDEKDKK